MDVRASRGIVKDYNNPYTPSGQQPPNDYKAMEQMWKRDEVIATAMDTTVDMVTRNGWDFVAKTNDKKLSSTELNSIIKRFQDFKFEEVLDNLIYQMITYGDAFLELRRMNGTKITELHPLETTEMRIDYDLNGTINGYSQIPSNANVLGMKGSSATMPGQIDFRADGVIHFRMKWLGSKIYSETPLQPVARIWATKQNSFNYLDQLFMNLRPELFVHLKGASKTQFEQVEETLWRSKVNPGKPIVTYGAADSGTDIKESTANFGNVQGLFHVLEYLRESVLMITRVPPVWIGMVNRDGANKGNSEAQIFSFETRVGKIQRKIADLINRELLPKLGYSHIEFNFNPISFKSEENAVKNAAVLSSINVKPEGIIKYLRRNGITDVMIEDIRTPEEMQETMMMGQDNQTATNKTAPSREKADGSSVINNKLSQDGSSKAGTKKREEKSLKTRSMGNYTHPKYWTYNKVEQ